MATPSEPAGESPTNKAFLTLLPLRVDQGMTIDTMLTAPSPWGSPLVMGASGTDSEGKPLLVLVNETPVNFLRTAQALDEPDKWQLEMLHLQRASVDARIATGSDLFRAIEKGSDPPDATISLNGAAFGWELTTFSIQSRRLAHDLFMRIRGKVAYQQRHRIGHLSGHLIYMWFGVASNSNGLPYRKNDATAVDQLVEALVGYQPDPTKYMVESQGELPQQLPGGFEAVNAPGDVEFFCTPFVNAAPTSPLFSMTGIEIGLAYQSLHSVSEEWEKLRSTIRRKDCKGNDILLISVGAPDKFGTQYPSEELLADFLLAHPEPVECEHLSSVILHYWGSGRGINLLGDRPQELWSPIYRGTSPASQTFATFS